jgi:hypothetical protein
MADTIDWPRDLVAPRHWNRGFNPQSLNDDRLSLSGRLSNGGTASRGIWAPSFVDVPVNEARNLAAWQALEMQINGRDFPINVPYYPRGKYPKAGEVATAGFSDGALFSDGTGLLGAGTTAIAGAVSAAGSVLVTITKTCCGTVKPGHAFSVNGHLYAVRFVEAQDDETAVVEVAPELRQAILPRDEIEFTFPVLTARLKNPRAFAQQLQYGRFGLFTVQFIEDTTPSDA